MEQLPPPLTGTTNAHQGPPPLAPAASPPPAVYASFGQRLLAWVIDAAVLFVLQLAVLVAVSTVAGLFLSDDPESDAIEGTIGLVMMAAMFLVGWP